MNEPQETQPQQSAEDGTVACESGLLSACTQTKHPQNVG